jgi:hypothetical protein
MNPDPAAQAKLEDILHPSPTAKTFRITVVFGYRLHPQYKKAVLLAKRNPTYREEGEGEWIRHSAVYTPAEVEDLFDLFNIVHDWEHTEILVNHKPLPYGHQLWLPLMWFHRIK